MEKNAAWDAIFDTYDLHNHDFSKAPFEISAVQIKAATNNTEPRILCKQDTRESRPEVFKKNGLFILPIKNGHYAIIEGEGYVDLPPILENADNHQSVLGFIPDTIQVYQAYETYIDYAFATGLFNRFMSTEFVLVYTGTMQTSHSNYHAGNYVVPLQNYAIHVDGLYESRDLIMVIHYINRVNYLNNVNKFNILSAQKSLSDSISKPVVHLVMSMQAVRYHLWSLAVEQTDRLDSIRVTNQASYIIDTSI